jgi:hypothetical protein
MVAVPPVMAGMPGRQDPSASDRSVIELAGYDLDAPVVRHQVDHALALLRAFTQL